MRPARHQVIPAHQSRRLLPRRSRPAEVEHSRPLEQCASESLWEPSRCDLLNYSDSESPPVDVESAGAPAKVYPTRRACAEHYHLAVPRFEITELRATRRELPLAIQTKSASSNC